MSFLKHFTRLSRVAAGHQYASTLSRPDTIYALASQISPKGSPVAVLRVSGHNVPEVAKLLTRKKLLPNPRSASLNDFYDPQNDDLIDKGILLWYPSPNSYTGEDVIELMLHGSHAVIARMMKVLGSLPSLRPAEPGEFTKRSFLNGKMDLVSAEAVNDLIEAKSESQRKRALSAVSGHTSQLYQFWRQSLLHLISNVEATIDFGEDQLLDDTIESCIQKTINLSEDISQYIEKQSRRNHLSRNGINVAIIGEPNAGKSSLMNILCQKDVSIVSPVQGTTRDVVQVTMEMNEYYVNFYDTAGIRDNLSSNPQDQLEKEGIRRAELKIRDADLIVALFDASTSINLPESIVKLISKENNSANVVSVANKSDLLSSQSDKSIQADCVISCLTNQGVEELENKLSLSLEQLIPQVDDCFINERHLTHLQQVINALDASRETFRHDLAITARHLLLAVDSLAAITNRITTEDVLDEIFLRFCIGK